MKIENAEKAWVLMRQYQEAQKLLQSWKDSTGFVDTIKVYSKDGHYLQVSSHLINFESSKSNAIAHYMQIIKTIETELETL